MTLRGKKAHISIAAFLLIFCALLCVATFYDLQISRIMTRFSLREGEYYTADLFANFFEAAGMLPRYLMRAFSVIAVGWAFVKSVPQKYLRVIVLVIAACIATYFLSGGVRDLIFYPMRHAIGENAEAAARTIAAMSPTIYLISYFCAGAIVLAVLFGTRNIPLDTWVKLTRFALVYFLMDILSGSLVSFLKGYVDRVRFRSMNSVYGQGVGGFSLYTRWYEVTDHAALMRATPLSDYTDAFRSFPSGHTLAAASSYGLILLIDCLEIREKRTRILLWALPIAWTALTAMGRIVAGAHFMSDVLFGGTIPFVIMMLLREGFLRGFATVKEMFPRGKKTFVMIEKKQNNGDNDL